jgi:hypothetical protein
MGVVKERAGGGMVRAKGPEIDDEGFGPKSANR